MPKKEKNDYIDDLPRGGPGANGDKKKAMTPADIVGALLGDNPKAIISAIQGKRSKRRGKKMPPTKYKSRTIGINKDGKAIVTKTEFTEAHLEKEKAKKADAKKAAKKDKKEA